MSDKALFIAVPHGSLPGVDRDPVRWHALLTDVHGFPDDARLLTLPAVHCSHDDILAAIRGHLVIGASPGDRRVLTISAHGASSAQGDRFYATDRAVLEAEVNGVLADLPAGVRLTCVHDCCRTFTEIEAIDWQQRVRVARTREPAGSPARLAILEPALSRQPTGSVGWLTVKSCRVRESSYHDPAAGSYFGHHLDEEVRRDPTADASTAVSRAWGAMAGWLRDYQHPEIHGPAEMLAAPLFGGARAAAHGGVC